MKNLILILLFCFNVSCASYNAEREKIRLEKKKIAYEHQLNLDKLTCKKYGFEESTTNFSNCMMELDITRKKYLAQKKALECQSVRQSNMNSGVTGFWGGVLMGLRESMSCN